MLNTVGHVCDGRVGRLTSSSPIIVEARSLLEDVSLTSSYPKPCMVFSDCLNLVNFLKGPQSHWPWECFGLLACITNSLRDYPTIFVRFTQ
ncbi:hypothetical protein LINPERHAP1_LOCUS34287 [Linum perenne]